MQLDAALNARIANAAAPSRCVEWLGYRCVGSVGTRLSSGGQYPIPKIISPMDFFVGFMPVLRISCF